MITLHIAKLLEDNGFGKLALTGSETGSDLIFFEKLPINKTGIFIMSNGDAIQRGRRWSQTFNIYARGVNDIAGGKLLEKILDFFQEQCYPVCDLPTVGEYSDTKYIKALILPTSNILNVGIDGTNRVIYSISGQIIYNKLKEI